MAGTGQEFFEATTKVAVENLVLVLEEVAKTSLGCGGSVQTAEGMGDGGGAGGNTAVRSSSNTVASLSTTTSSCEGTSAGQRPHTGGESYVAYVNLPDAGGARALHHAAIEGHTELVRVLLQHRADPCAVDHRSRTPIDYATSLNQLETVAVLESAATISRGAGGADVAIAGSEPADM